MISTGKNTFTRFFITSMVAIIMAIYYFSELKPFEYKGLDEAINALERFAAELNAAIIQNRFGTLKYYDPLDNALMLIRGTMGVFEERIKENPNEALKENIDTLSVTFKKKEELVLAFKRINPVLNNAIYQFSSLLKQIIKSQEGIQLAGPQQDDHYQLMDKIHTLFQGFLVYIIYYTEETHAELAHLIQDIRVAPQKLPKLNEALAYADKILELQPKMSEIDRSLSQVPIVSSLNTLSRTWNVAFQNYLSHSYIYRAALYLLVFILLVALRWLFSRLRGMVITLHVEVQHKIKAEKQLEEINRQLEQRITERTQELTIKNKDLNQALTTLKEAQDQLIIQEKMASIGILTTGIAHEIKNPLNFINNFSDISVELLEELENHLNEQKTNLQTQSFSTIEELTENLKINCKKIKEYGGRADNIVKSMLFHSQEASTQKELVNIPLLLESSIKVVLQSFRSTYSTFNIKLEKSFPPHVKPILAAPQAIGRVFIYIIDNALYALHTKQTSTSSPDYKPILNIHIQQTEDSVIIRIRDNGIGISPKNIGRIFEPFFTTKPTGKGNTGLGLSICYDTIVKQHKGELRVLSKENEFTEFTIVFPSVKA